MSGWWGVAIAAADQYSPWALNAKAENAYRQSWGQTHDKMTKAFNAEDTMRRAEQNTARISNDKQLATMQLSSQIASQKADLRVQAALTGNTGTMVDAGDIAIEHQGNQQREDIIATAENRTRQEIDTVKSAAYDFYVLNQPYVSGAEELNIFGLKT